MIKKWEAMDSDDLLDTATWISKKGGLDPKKFPIDGVLKQTLDTNADAFRAGIYMLRSMCSHGREEAGVFLLGLFLVCGDDWERRALIAEALQGVKTRASADLLFEELRRVKSSNTTRRYLATVIRALASMPSALVKDGFAALADDKSYSQTMRTKFRAAVEDSSRFDNDWL
jgi:hypothetical protein